VRPEDKPPLHQFVFPFRNVETQTDYSWLKGRKVTLLTKADNDTCFSAQSHLVSDNSPRRGDERPPLTSKGKLGSISSISSTGISSKQLVPLGPFSPTECGVRPLGSNVHTLQIAGQHLMACAASESGMDNAEEQGAASEKITSQYRGITWLKSNSKWRAVIGHCGKQQHLGYFTNQIEAAKAYDSAARTHHGKSAKLNFPGADEQQGAAKEKALPYNKYQGVHSDKGSSKVKAEMGHGGKNNYVGLLTSVGTGYECGYGGTQRVSLSTYVPSNSKPIASEPQLPLSSITGARVELATELLTFSGSISSSATQKAKQTAYAAATLAESMSLPARQKSRSDSWMQHRRVSLAIDDLAPPLSLQGTGELAPSRRIFNDTGEPAKDSSTKQCVAMNSACVASLLTLQNGGYRAPKVTTGLGLKDSLSASASSIPPFVLRNEPSTFVLPPLLGLAEPMAVPAELVHFAESQSPACFAAASQSQPQQPPQARSQQQQQHPQHHQHHHYYQHQQQHPQHPQQHPQYPQQHPQQYPQHHPHHPQQQHHQQYPQYHHQQHNQHPPPPLPPPQQQQYYGEKNGVVGIKPEPGTEGITTKPSGSSGGGRLMDAAGAGAGTPSTSAQGPDRVGPMGGWMEQHQHQQHWQSPPSLPPPSALQMLVSTKQQLDEHLQRLQQFQPQQSQPPQQHRHQHQHQEHQQQHL
jgi:hypothetical protein